MPAGRSQMRQSPVRNTRPSTFKSKTTRSGTRTTVSVSRGRNAATQARAGYRTPRKIIQRTSVNRKGRGASYTNVITGRRAITSVNRRSYFTIKGGKVPSGAARVAGAYAGHSFNKTSKQRAAYKVVKQAGYRRSLVNYNPYSGPVKVYVPRRGGAAKAGRRGGARRTRRDSKGKYAGSY